MKKNITQKGKSTLLALVIMVTIITSTGVTNAQTTVSINTSCFTEWDTFISSTISINEFKEYWKDIFVRYNQNTCYYMDVDAILKQIDTTRSQLREAILGCKDQQVIPLEAKYYELEIELEYLRTFISFADKKGKLISEEKVYRDIRIKK